MRRWWDQWIVYPCEGGRIAEVGVLEEKNWKGYGFVVEYMKLTLQSISVIGNDKV